MTKSKTDFPVNVDWLTAAKISRPGSLNRAQASANENEHWLGENQHFNFPGLIYRPKQKNKNFVKESSSEVRQPRILRMFDTEPMGLLEVTNYHEPGLWGVG